MEVKIEINRVVFNDYESGYFDPVQRITLGAFHKLRLHLGWVGGQKNV